LVGKNPMMILRYLKQIIFLCIFILIFLSTADNVSFSISQDKKEVFQEISQVDSKFYDKNIKGQNVKIAVLDTGVDKKCKDIKYIKGENFTSKDSTDFQDRNGHGTKIAGIIGARENDIGMIGMASESDLYISKVADDRGNVKFENLVKGVLWAIQNKVDIINISLEFAKDNDSLKKVYREAAEKNILIFAPCGTSPENKKKIKTMFPARYKTVISVGMLSQGMGPDIGSKLSKATKIDVWQTGEDLTSTYLDNKLTLDTGVSFATATASGYAAVVLQAFKEKNTPYNKQDILKAMNADMDIAKAIPLIAVGIIIFANI
jgi:subtilisin family serine protease